MLKPVIFFIYFINPPNPSLHNLNHKTGSYQINLYTLVTTSPFFSRNESDVYDAEPAPEGYSKIRRQMHQKNHNHRTQSSKS